MIFFYKKNVSFSYFIPNVVVLVRPSILVLSILVPAITRSAVVHSITIFSISMVFMLYLATGTLPVCAPMFTLIMVRT